MKNHVNDAGASGILGDFLANFRIPLEGFNGNSDGTWSPALSRVLMRDSSGSIVAYNPTPAPIAGTDILAVRTTEGRVQVEPPSMPTVAAALHVATNNGMQRGDIVLVSDCESSEVFQISNNNPSTSGTVDHATGNSVSPGNETKEFQKSYGTDAMIFRPSIKTYYIGMGNDGRNALWELNNHRSLNLDSTDAIEDNPRELIQGVEDMQITYGVDDDGDANADRFVDASAVDDSTTPADEWLQVVSVRFSLLLETQEDYLATEPQKYTYNSTSVTAGDRRLRRVFTNTVGIRNRMP
jgi:type IV pilus assembly protein PilW